MPTTIPCKQCQVDCAEYGGFCAPLDHTDFEVGKELRCQCKIPLSAVICGRNTGCSCGARCGGARNDMNKTPRR